MRSERVRVDFISQIIIRGLLKKGKIISKYAGIVQVL